MSWLLSYAFSMINLDIGWLIVLLQWLVALFQWCFLSVQGLYVNLLFSFIVHQLSFSSHFDNWSGFGRLIYLSQWNHYKSLILNYGSEIWNSKGITICFGGSIVSVGLSLHAYANDLISLLEIWYTFFQRSDIGLILTS